MWYLYGDQDQRGGDGLIMGILAKAREKVGEAARGLLESRSRPLYLQQLSPAAAMFGSASLSIGKADADLLSQTLLAAFTPDGEPPALNLFVESRPLSQMRAAYEEGYDLALDLLEQLDLPGEKETSIDLAQVVQELEIEVTEIELDDDTLRGVALAGNDLRPTILVNTCHPMNKRESGRRFTLAHELCHILHDRGYARRVSLISGPWAPPGVERRANAFAAMLLMPPELVNHHISALPFPDIASFGAIEALSQRMGTGFLATLEHLTNIGKLDDAQRESIGNAAWRKVGFDA